jgi:chitodextrinase
MSARMAPTWIPRPLVLLVGWVLLISLIGGAPSRAVAADVSTTFIAVADAQVTESAPTTTHPTAPLRADGGADPDVESYLRFGVNGLVGQVLSATLRVYATTGTVDGPSVYGTSTTWAESTITWADRPARVTAAVADRAAIAAPAWVEYNVTALVTGDGTIAVVLATTSNDGIDFLSREGAQPPQLVVRSSSTPPDTSLPTTATNVAATATSSTDVVLTWTAATDDVAVTGYEVHRGGALLATIPPTTTYSDRTVWSSTTFSYRLRAFDAAGNRSAFSDPIGVTTPGGSDPIVVAAGDIATCGQPGHAATAALLDEMPGVVAVLGDLAYPNGTAAEFQDCYGPTWGRHRARTRPAVGNHEYQTLGATPYYDYFGAAAGDPAKGYYSYDIGAWHVVVVNSNCASIAGGCAAGSPQEQWLRADLAANPASCTLAYWHHPVFSSGDHGNQAFMAPMWQTLYDGGAEIVLAGHDHHYERFAPQTAAGVADPVFGIRGFVVGTGGRDSHRLLRTIAANSQVRDIATFGVLRLELGSDGYAWAFVPEVGRSFTDSGVGSCHDAPAPGDTTPPVTTITAGPAQGSTEPTASASFAFSANESPVTFMTSLDGAAATQTASPRSLTGLSDGLHRFSAWAINAAGNTGIAVERTWTVAEPPSPPGGLTASAPSPTRVDLGWTAATDNSGVTGYLVYRNGDPTPIATLGGVTSYSDTSVAPSTAYSYVVRARDAAGTLSGPSGPATATTPSSPPPPPPPTTTVTLAPAADARVQEANASTNYGSADYLRTDGATDPDVESYLRFTISGISGTIQTAKLRVYAYNGTVDGPAAYRAATDSWTESGLTWANRPARSGAALADRGAIAINSWVEYDVTAAVSGNGTVSFVLATTSSDGVDLRSRESATASQRPQLVLTVAH